MEAKEETKGVASRTSRTCDQLSLPTRSSLRLRNRAEKQKDKREPSDRKRAARTEEQDVEEPHQDDQSENDNDNKQETSSALTPLRRSPKNRNVNTRISIFDLEARS
jgi:hypothetical protein